jgi:hypothetical protein
LHIRHEKDGSLIMTETIVCKNFFDANLKHYMDEFERVSDYEYKCKSCGEVIKITRRPIIIHEESGRLKVQVVID